MPSLYSLTLSYPCLLLRPPHRTKRAIDLIVHLTFLSPFFFCVVPAKNPILNVATSRFSPSFISIGRIYSRLLVWNCLGSQLFRPIFGCWSESNGVVVKAFFSRQNLKFANFFKRSMRTISGPDPQWYLNSAFGSQYLRFLCFSKRFKQSRIST